MTENIYICSAIRTPIGSFQGSLSSLSAPQLGAHSIEGAVLTSGVDPSMIDEVYMGNVISAGVGQSPARQATILSGLSNAIPATTVSKVCGSGMKAIMLAANSIKAGETECVIAGGMESMSRAPFILEGARSGYRLGHQSVRDTMMVDGLEDIWSGKSMGVFGQKTADQYNITREKMDEYALASLNRAKDAAEAGHFSSQIRPIKYTNRSGEFELDIDELISLARPEKIPLLKPAFSKDGSITAANSSAISDGAAALLLANEKHISSGLEPMAKIVAQCTHAQEPSEFTLAPIDAIEKVLKKANWTIQDVDLFEINEAFAAVTMIAMDSLDIGYEKVNVNGGACILGHPLGASGARIVVTLLHELKRRGKTKGVASLCIGGGEATAIAIEMV